MNYLDLILALSGFLVGIIIAILAKEEINAGKKYFFWIKNLLWAMLEIVILIFFIKEQSWTGLVILVIISFIILLLELSYNKNTFTLFLPYPLVIAAYLLLADTSAHYWLTSLTFLYGLPAAALVYEERKLV